MSDRAITIPYARSNDGNRYTARQMSKELYAYKLRWKGFACPVEGCNRNLKWTQCSVKGKFWSHKQSKNSELSDVGGVAHSGETWSHITAKAKVVDNLQNIRFRAKKCHCCNQFKTYSFNSPSNSAKTEHLILKGIRADVAVFEDEKLIAMVSIVKTHSREPEKWQKIYDELGVMLFEVMADDVLDDDTSLVYSNIYVHWGMCKECIVVWEEIKALRKNEPQFVVEDGRHLSELKHNELSKLRHTKDDLKQKVEELLRERGVCFRCCKPCKPKDFCVPCKKFLNSTNCADCGRKTMTTWKQYCYVCFEDKKEKKRKREEEERQEEERKRREEQKRRREEQERRWEEERKKREEGTPKGYDVCRCSTWKRNRYNRCFGCGYSQTDDSAVVAKATKEKPKKGEVRYFGKTYASEPEFLKAHGVVHFSVSKRFRLTPTPTQEERKRYFLKKVQ
jgi:hypothetical protein